MSIEQYSLEVIVIAVADGPSVFKVWLREEPAEGLKGDLQWLCEEYMDSHVVLDLADLTSLEAANYGLMLDLQRLVEESNYRFVLCSLSPHLKWQLQCVRLVDEFDTFDNREAAIMALTPEDTY
ncbi:MAG: anti-sigma factor antagonist [Sedimentisphaerales bacterium]|nr:anti-sigma factor antagonist [Sedimentisphaerales bacterium]